MCIHLLQAKASVMENGLETPESVEEIEKLEEQALSLRQVNISLSCSRTMRTMLSRLVR